MDADDQIDTNEYLEKHARNPDVRKRAGENKIAAKVAKELLTT